MTPGELREARDTLGLSQERMARLVGVVARAYQRYEADDVAVPEPVAALVECVLQHPAAHAWALRRAGAQKSRGRKKIAPDDKMALECRDS